MDNTFETAPTFCEQGYDLMLTAWAVSKTKVKLRTVSLSLTTLHLWRTDPRTLRQRFTCKLAHSYRSMITILRPFVYHLTHLIGVLWSGVVLHVMQFLRSCQIFTRAAPLAADPISGPLMERVCNKQ